MKTKLLLCILLLSITGCTTKTSSNPNFLEVGKKYTINLASTENADDSGNDVFENRFTIISSAGGSWYLVEYAYGQQKPFEKGTWTVESPKKHRIWLNIDHVTSIAEAK